MVNKIEFRNRHYFLNVIILGICLIQASVQTQGQNFFLKKFDFPGYQSANSLVEDNAGNFMIAGSGQVANGAGLFTFAAKTDAKGNLLWRKLLGDGLYDNGSKILKTSEGFIILGNWGSIGPVIYTIDSEGNLITQNMLLDSMSFALSMEITIDNGLIIAAANSQKDPPNYHDIWLTKTDIRGAKIWSRHYGSPTENEIANRVLPLSNGDFLVTGSTTENSVYPFYENIIVFRIDSQGNEIWKIILGGPEQNVPFDLVKTKDGAFLIISNTTIAPGGMDIIKIDAKGNVLWHKPVVGKKIGIPRAGVETPEGNFIIAGEGLVPTTLSYEPPGTRSAVVWGVSSGGDLLWQREYRVDPYYSLAFSVIKTSDNNYLVGGVNTNPNDVDFFLLKIGADGCDVNKPKLGLDTATCSAPVSLDAGEGYDHYTWSSGDTTRNITVDKTGLYSVSVSESNGCSSSDSVTVTVKNCFLFDHCKNLGYEEKEILLPNVITPNGDGLNDTFKLPGFLSGSGIRVFNRWGKEVYSNDDYENNWYGDDVSGGTYYYILSSQCLNRSLKGILTILK